MVVTRGLDSQNSKVAMASLLVKDGEPEDFWTAAVVISRSQDCSMARVMQIGLPGVARSNSALAGL